MRLHKRYVAITGAAVAVLALTAGCSSEADGADASGGQGAASGGQEPGAQAVDGPTLPEWTLGPLDEIMNEIHGWDATDAMSAEDHMAQFDYDNQRREEFIAACMAELGFDYIPNTNNVSIMISDGSQLSVPLNSRQFAETYGFGISTDPWGHDSISRDYGEWEDPNAALTEAMSEAELNAYIEALWGAATEPDEDGNWPEWDPANAGCSGAAFLEYPGTITIGAVDIDQFAALQDEVWGLWEVAENDPRVVSARAQLDSCLAPFGIDRHISEAMWSQWSEMNWGSDELWQNWDFDAYPEGPVFDPDPADIADFTEREIANAVAFFDCSLETNVDQILMDVNYEIQQDFVNLHQAELDAWLEHANSTR